MSKIGQEVHLDESKLIIKETHDFNPILNKAAALRSSGAENFGESKLVGVIPMKLWAEWAKKWGVRADDKEAMRDVLLREMNNPDNAHFRVWGGRV